ncbi:hypothetical protein MALGJ_16670 [Mycolicibacter algericus]|uniref:Integrase catalytic domain-containing protein n=1 Tax=Mycolicibacter algericus TaxID=1288388 RepID=A0A7I9Y8I5_MYCAL|nr:hypothetical protein MALGJ_16670 [Mycolicibacter algericus]
MRTTTRRPVHVGGVHAAAHRRRSGPSVGSVGDALDNALAETTVGSFKNELIHRQGPWRDVSQVELATAEWVDWFNTERPHDYLDDFTPAAVEALHYDHRHTPPKAG